MSEENKAPDGAADDSASKKQDTVSYETYSKVLDQRKADLAKLRELEAKQAEWDAEKVAKENEEAKKRGDFEKLEQSLKAEATEYKAKYEHQVINSSLQSALIENKVAPAFLEAATALFASKGITLDKDGNALVGNIALSEAVAAWANSDTGKAFVAAPDSSGGGANGSGASNNLVGNMGGTREERIAAINAKLGNKLNKV